ncbi:MAG: phosphoribosyltransferase family protein [Planctomycetota bacterium]|jgi:hypoxanthine phosphoribosyltransferase|nr:phosphoribosyltransferase family protein [Planctomycetota bacterium]
MIRYRHRIVLRAQELSEALDGLADRLKPLLGDDEVTAIPVLGGAMFFAADLVRRLPSGLVMDFIRIQTYGDATSPQKEAKPEWLPHPDNVKGKHVLLMDDILDTGRTMTAARCFLLEEMGAAKVTIAVLIDKPVRRAVPISADAFAVQFQDDQFLVGFGLDYRGRFRNLPFLAALETDLDGLPMSVETTEVSKAPEATGESAASEIAK